MPVPRLLSKEEFDRDWLAIGRRVVGCDGFGGWQVPAVSPFAHTEWQVVLMEDSPISPGSVIQEFWDGCPETSYPTALKLEHVYEPLMRTLRDRGTTEICLVDETLSYDQRPHPLVIPPIESDLGFASKEFSWARPCLVIDRSADWGLACYYDRFSLLGGTAEFMKGFFANAGGERAVQLRFYWFADTDAEPLPVEIFEICGWEPPEYSRFRFLDGEEIFEYAPLWWNEMR